MQSGIMRSNSGSAKKTKKFNFFAITTIYYNNYDYNKTLKPEAKITYGSGVSLRLFF